jgi:hypothetical protein
MKIGNVSRHMNCRNLSGSLGCLAEAAHHTVYNQAAMIHPLAETYKVAIGLDLTRLGWKVQDCLLLFLAQDRASGKPIEK